MNTTESNEVKLQQNCQDYYSSLTNLQISLKKITNKQKQRLNLMLVLQGLERDLGFLPSSQEHQVFILLQQLNDQVLKLQAVTSKLICHVELVLSSLRSMIPKQSLKR